LLARIADTFDVTSEVISRNSGVYSEAETMLALGIMVADIMMPTIRRPGL